MSKNMGSIIQETNGYTILHGFKSDSLISACFVKEREEILTEVEKLKNHGAYVICVIKSDEAFFNF